eukprot:9475132-Pyramimonas_sp.AAC.1
MRTLAGFKKSRDVRCTGTNCAANFLPWQLPRDTTVARCRRRTTFLRGVKWARLAPLPTAHGTSITRCVRGRCRTVDSYTFPSAPAQTKIPLSTG